MAGGQQLYATLEGTSYTCLKSDNLIAKKLPVVGLATHKMHAADLAVGPVTPRGVGREKPTT